MPFSLVMKPRWAVLAAIVAVLFGALTLFSGGSVLFVDGKARVDAGNYVGFVLWFNFLAGFAYILAGIGLFVWREWAVRLAMVIFVATLTVFAGLGLHIWMGGAYEMRTVLAMVLRTGVWMIIAFATRAAWRDPI